jgi:hypothetical protein
MLWRRQAGRRSGTNGVCVSTHRALQIAVAAVALALFAILAGPSYLWDLVDDHVDVPLVRDCRGLRSHPWEC